VVQPFGAEKNLEIPEKMPENEAEQHDAGDGNDQLFADGRFIESNRPV
jgi:hypothetical protein